MQERVSQTRVYHRKESPTQTSDGAVQQETSGELWGYPSITSNRPKVKAYDGPLPDGERGIEFTTDVAPDPVVRQGVLSSRNTIGRGVASPSKVTLPGSRSRWRRTRRRERSGDAMVFTWYLE